MGAASAPAPAREPKAGVSTEHKSAPVLPEISLPKTKSSEKAAAIKENSASAVESSAPAMFTFGGTIDRSSESGGSGSKKLLLAAAVLIALGGGYAAWTHRGQSNTTPIVPDQVLEAPVKSPATIQQPKASSQTPAANIPATDTQTATAGGEQKHPSKVTAAANSLKPSLEAVASNKTPEAEPAPEPIVLKNNSSRAATKLLVINDAPVAPSMAGIAPAGNGDGLPNLMDSHSKAPTPVLQTLSVSQGVSQGLLVKKVQPKYPANSLRLRVEGAVQLLATISKAGDIAAVKVISGDPQLARAAADAVKQWKYKPYLLNGLPVEIQTQVTVNFKLPN
jgi:protein TonB